MSALPPIGWVCQACGAEADGDVRCPTRCPATGGGPASPGTRPAEPDRRDHLLLRRLDPARVRFPDAKNASTGNPFLDYRDLLYSYQFHVSHGGTPAAYERRVRTLDEAVHRIDGRGFRVTPCLRNAQMESSLLPRGEVWVKDETVNVAGSHKGRHLFGVALALQGPGAREQGLEGPPLAIASCGNAALAASVVARAAGRALEVFVPVDADATVVETMRALGSGIHVCERRAGELGDPCVLRMREIVSEGAVPFTVQARENAQVLDGGATLAYEIAAAMRQRGRSFDRVFVQVGGGALASSLTLGLEEARALGVIDRVPRIHAVQARGCHPLARAYRLLCEAAGLSDEACGAGAQAGRSDAMERSLALAAHDRSQFMWPWDAPYSRAHGILDDETYDWLPVARGMWQSGGGPVVVDEDDLRRAEALAPCADATGAAALAGLVHATDRGEIGSSESVLVLLTGMRRKSQGSATSVESPESEARPR